MKRLVLFALLAVAAWYGWKHQDQLRLHGTHLIVAMNRSPRALERVRIQVAGQSFAIEALEQGATTQLGLRSEQDGTFDVVWNVRGIDGERHWTGGNFYHGPKLMRHQLEFVDGDAIIWNSERIATTTERPR